MAEANDISEIDGIVKEAKREQIEKQIGKVKGYLAGWLEKRYELEEKAKDTEGKINLCAEDILKLRKKL